MQNPTNNQPPAFPRHQIDETLCLSPSLLTYGHA